MSPRVSPSERLRAEIDEVKAAVTYGWGVIPVEVGLGETTWSTSLFPDNKAKSYLLPMKKPVRTAEGLRVGDQVEIELELLDVEA